VTSLLERVTDVGIDIFAGVEMTDRLAKIASEHFGKHTSLMIRWPCNQGFKIWVRVKHTNAIEYLVDTYKKLDEMADAFVLDHRIPICRKSNELVLFEFLKALKENGVLLNNWILDLDAHRSVCSQDERKRLICLFYDYQMKGLSFADYVDDFPPITRRDMVHLSLNYNYFV